VKLQTASIMFYSRGMSHATSRLVFCFILPFDSLTFLISVSYLYFISAFCKAVIHTQFRLPIHLFNFFFSLHFSHEHKKLKLLLSYSSLYSVTDM
jgi:hypothetical protein